MALLSVKNIWGLFSTQPQTANTPNYRLSPLPSRSGVIYDTTLSINNLGQTVGELITSIRVGTGGNLVVQGPSGDIFYYGGLLDGQIIYGKFIAVLSSGLINSNGYTSTALIGSVPTVPSVTVTTSGCDHITWFGGET